MGKLETAMKEEVGRLARKELRKTVGPLKKEIVRLKKRVAELSRSHTDLSKKARVLVTARGKQSVAADVSDEQAESARMSAGLIKKLRARLGISQAELALLVGVSGPAVAAWEQDRAMPSGDNRKAVIALRAFGRRQVRELLRVKNEEKAKAKAKATRPGRKKKKKKAGRKKKKR